MATATTNSLVVAMRLAESGLAGAMACRPSSCALHLHRAPSGLSLVASSPHSSARFISVLSFASCRTSLNVLAIHALDPDFYKIPYVEGIPVGKRLKLWNLPPNCKHSELMEWFTGIDVTVESLEFTNDPGLNAQGIGGFVEFATKQQACIAIVRLDGYKFRGHCIRMDFAEKRPHPRDYGSRRNRPIRSSSSSRGSFATPSRPPVTDMVPSYGSATSANAQSTPMYEAAQTNVVQASSEHESSSQSGYRSSSGNGEGIRPNPTYGNPQPPPVYSSTPMYEAAQTSVVQASSEHESSSQSGYRSSSGNLEGIRSNPTYGNPQPPPVYSSTPVYEAVQTNVVQASSEHGNGSQSGYRSSSGNGEGIRSNSTYGNPQPPPVYSSTSRTTGHGGTGKSPIGTAPNDVREPLRNPGSQGPSLNSSYGKMDLYEDPFKSYGVPDEAVVEPWSKNTNFRSGPMYGSPQPASSNRLFVGNLDVSVDDAALQELFSRFGTVLEARVLRDQESGRSRGFGLVAMSSVNEIKAASEALDGWQVKSRPLKVNAVAFKH